MLDRALTEMIENLIAGDLVLARDGEGFGEILLVEIADAPREDLAFTLELVKRGKGLGERMLAAPMQEIAVEPVGLEPLERGFAGAPRSTLGSIGGKHLGDEKDVVAPAMDRFADDRLGGTGAIHLRRVDVAEAQIQTAPQRRDGHGPVGVLDIPCALADDGNRAPAGAELSSLHHVPL